MTTLALFIAASISATVILAAILAAVSPDDGERPTAAPLPAKACPNCSAYYLGIRCESCRWTEPDDDAVDDPTDVEPTQPDLDSPDIGGEGGP